jgi:hypothetical protein
VTLILREVSCHVHSMSSIFARVGARAAGDGNVRGRGARLRASGRAAGCAFGIACAVYACVGAASAATDDAPMLAICRSDSDCKLIYSSCTCEAVGKSDAREYLDNDHGIACNHNICRSENAKAVCDAGLCARAPPSGKTASLPAAKEASSGH